MRLVLDTNTVMALWHFADPALAALRACVEHPATRLYCREDALEELQRVLAYRQFALADAQQQALFAVYRQRVACVAPALPAGAAELPRCRDRDDQKFLEIARDAGADCLLTRDKALLRLHRHRLIRPLYAILTPEAFQLGLGPTPGD